MGMESLGAIGSAIGSVGKVVAENASAIGDAAKAVTSIASVGMGIYETVNGDTGKGMMMIAAGAALGADSMSDMFKSSEDSTPDSEQLDIDDSAITPTSLKSVESSSPKESDNTVLGGDLLSNPLSSSATNRNSLLSAARSDLRDDATKSIQTSAPVMQSSKTPVTDAINKQQESVSSIPQAEQKATSGGLLGGINSFIKDNKEVVSLVGNTLAYNDAQKERRALKQMDFDQQNRLIANNVLAPQGAKFNAATGRMQ